MNKIITLYNQYEPMLIKHRLEIFKLITSEIRSFENYYSKAKLCDERKVFSQKTVFDIINLIEIDTSLFEKNLKEVTVAKYKTVMDVNYIIFLFVARMFAKRKEFKKVDEVTLHIIHRMFSALLLKYYKFGCDKEVFDYTINNMSNKYMFKNYGGNIVQINNAFLGSYPVKYNPYLISNNDDKFIGYLVGLRSRINNIMRTVANEYYKNKENGSLIKSNSAVVDEKGEEISNYDNDNSQLYALKSKVVNNFVNHSYDDKFYNKLKTVININDYSEIDKFWKKFKKDSKMQEDIFLGYISILSSEGNLEKLCKKDSNVIIANTFNKNKKGRYFIKKNIRGIVGNDKQAEKVRLKQELFVTLLLTLYIREIKCRRN